MHGMTKVVLYSMSALTYTEIDSKGMHKNLFNFV